MRFSFVSREIAPPRKDFKLLYLVLYLMYL